MNKTYAIERNILWSEECYKKIILLPLIKITFIITLYINTIINGITYILKSECHHVFQQWLLGVGMVEWRIDQNF